MINDDKYIRKDCPLSGLTSKIIGCAYDVYNRLGYGLAEKVYQKAMAQSLKESGINFRREAYGMIKYKETVVGKYFLDFMVENLVAVEFKVRNEIYETDTNQLLNYIKSENLPVGLLIVFSKDKLKIKRLANTKSAINQR